MSGLIIDSDESFIRMAKDFPPARCFDLVDKAASRIAVALGLSKGVRLHVVGTEQDLPGYILEQAAKEGTLGQVVAVHLRISRRNLTV
jgi:hypothetical protein